MVDNRRWVDAIRELQEESLIHNLSPIGPDAVQENQEDGATDEQKAHHITTPVIERREGVDGVLCFCNMS